jgi:hypothetical protein
MGANVAVWSPSRADGAWIDAPLQNWNVAGQPVPMAPPTSMEAIDQRCLDFERPAETIEDVQVQRQGWRLVGMYYAGWNLRVVTATTKYDGMCRPLGYQMFAFLHGSFIGTLSPVLMDSRTDGASGNVFIFAHRPGEAPQMSAEFRRYKAEDPLCCPSSTSSVIYQVDFASGPPVLKPLQATTVENPGS